MKPPKEVKRLIHESKITTGPEADERILHDALYELEQRRRERMEPLDAVLWRALMKNRMTKSATVAVLVIAALAAIQFFGNPFGPQLTFASVVEPILNAGTASFDIVVGPEDGSNLVIHDAVMGSRVRRTVAGAEMVAVIIDLESGRILTLNKASMDAQYTDLKGMPSIQNYLESLKNSILIMEDMPDFTIEDLGRKQLDGKEVVGFFGIYPKGDITIWADVDTGLPMHVEQNAGQVHMIFKNIEFDLPMEDEMFSMEVPAGYTVQKPMTLDLQAGTEAKFIEGLRLIADAFNDGLFPDSVSLDSHLKMMFELSGRSEAMNLPEKEVQARAKKLTEYILFIRFFRGEGKWTYRGRGVMLGEAETPIFWYRPEKSETYRVIYGDLHVENVYPEDLPE
jgi:hypothetical protein